MKTALNQLKEKIKAKIIACEEQLQVLDHDKMPSVYMTTDAMRLAYINILKEIESLLPTERETTEDLKKEIEELKKENEKVFEVDFGNHLRAKIKVIGSNIKVLGAINGWGDGVPLEEIKIKTFTTTT